MLKAINELNRLSPELSARLEKAFKEVLHSGWYALGPQVSRFEKAFADYCGASNAVGVANGTDALQLVLLGLGIGAGDVVVAAANAGCYGTHAILATHATPRYADIDPLSFTLTADTLAAVDWHRVKAVIVTHLFGLMAPMPEILALAESHGVAVIEDCAQAHGATLEGRRSGSWGAVGCFSFYPTKNLGALGDGGAIVTSDGELAGKIRQLRQYGWGRKYQSCLEHGRNSRLDEVQAALLMEKLPSLDAWNERRREIARYYATAIVHPDIRHPSVFDDRYVAHLYVIRTRRRDSLSAHLGACGIPCDIHYPIPDYRQPSLVGRFPGISLPTTEAACAEILTLPCFPEMTGDETGQVADAVNSWKP